MLARAKTLFKSLFLPQLRPSRPHEARIVFQLALVNLIFVLGNTLILAWALFGIQTDVRLIALIMFSLGLLYLISRSALAYWTKRQGQKQRQNHEHQQRELRTRLVSITRKTRHERQSIQSQVALQIERQRTLVLNQFVNDISHDLLTPLSIIKTNLYLAQRQADRSKQLLYFSQVDKQLARLQFLIQGMLNMAHLDKLETHDLVLSKNNLNLFVSQIISTYHDTLNQYNLSAKLELYEPAPIIIVDVERLKLAVTCVLDNAIKFTPAGGHITLQTYQDATHATLSITDNGVGISEEDLPHIFEHFYRGKKHRPLDSGSGLGLTITQRIIQAHQGRISIESREGIGTKISLLLPIQTQSALKPLEHAQSTEHSTTETQDIQRSHTYETTTEEMKKVPLPPRNKPTNTLRAQHEIRIVSRRRR